MVREIAQKGLEMVLHSVFSCHQLLPVKRDRWIGAFVRKGVQLVHDQVRNANYVSFASCTFASVASEPSLGTADMLIRRCKPEDRSELCVADEALKVLGDPEVAPWWLKNKVAGLSHDELIEGRVVKEDQCPCFMASYGRRHEIDIALLREKGLQTILVRDDEGVRMLSPWEVLAALAYKPETVLTENVHVAWKQAGNGIAAAHA